MQPPLQPPFFLPMDINLLSSLIFFLDVDSITSESILVKPCAVIAIVYVVFSILVIRHDSLLKKIEMADEVGFEPTEVLPSTVFKTVALNHSATHPFT